MNISDKVEVKVAEIDSQNRNKPAENQLPRRK